MFDGISAVGFFFDVTEMQVVSIIVKVDSSIGITGIINRFCISDVSYFP